MLPIYLITTNIFTGKFQLRLSTRSIILLSAIFQENNWNMIQTNNNNDNDAQPITCPRK